MSDLKSCINQAGMTIPDSLHVMLILRTLPSTYEVMQQTILVNTQDYKMLTSTDMRSHLISEELHQGMTIGINTIRYGRKAMSTDSCNWYRGSGHWEQDCQRKQRGLSKEEAQNARKKGNKSKGKHKEDKKDSPSVNMIVEDVPPDPPSSTNHVTQNSTSNNAIVFYTGCETKWMLDSGCSDHITHEYSDFSDNHALASPQFVQLADGTTCISYIGTGTVMTMTHINGMDKTISLCNVIHCPEIGSHFLSIRKLGDRGIDTVFAGGKATLSCKGEKCTEGLLQGQQFWLTLHISTMHVHLVLNNININSLHARLGHLS